MKGLKAELKDYNSKYYGTIIELKKDGDYVGEIQIWANSHLHNDAYVNSPRETEPEGEHHNSHWECKLSYDIAQEMIRKINL
jgi:hypothetical protein